MADGSVWPTLPTGIDDPAIHQGDCLEVMALVIPDASIDVVVTSPPYNLDLAYNVYDDAKTEQEYLDWFVEVAGQIRRVLKPDGSFFLNIGGSNSQPWLPFELVVKLRRSGFKLQNHITWIKSIGTEQASSGHFKPIGGRRFMHHNHEHIFHLTLTNNVELDRLSIGIPFQDKSNIARRGHERDLRCRGNTWFIPYSTVKSKAQKFHHPGTFPVELPLWCIYLHGRHSPTVLDPFLGTGTTLVAARLAGAQAIGIDIDPTYIKTAQNRFRQTAEGAQDIIFAPEDIRLLLTKDRGVEKHDGWRGLLAGLQRRVNKTTGHLTITATDMEQIEHYFREGAGSSRDRLASILGRTLGPCPSGGDD